MTVTNEVIIKLTKQQFDLLKSKLNTVVSNVGYFPRKAMLESKTAPTLTLTVDQYMNFKQALSTMTTGDAAKFLDAFFDQGEEQAETIMNAMRAEQQATIDAGIQAQTGLSDLQEVKVEDIKKASKAKTTAKKKKA